MNSTQLLALFRSEINDIAPPFLWSDTDEIFPYIDDAQKWFCRLVNGIADANSDFTQLDVVAAETVIDIDPRILRIKGAYRISDGQPVKVISYENMDEFGIVFNNQTGPTRFLITGMDASTVRVHPIPSDTDVLQLVTERLPLEAITDEEQEFEIEEQHHMCLLDWVKYKAYSKQDAETRDDKKAAEHEARFRAYCAMARIEKERKKHKTRVVAYGGL